MTPRKTTHKQVYDEMRGMGKLKETSNNLHLLLVIVKTENIQGTE